MRNKVLQLLLLVSIGPVSAVVAAEQALFSAKSPEHRVAMLELYTSQGCSSCPPAEHWLSEFKQQADLGQRIIPLAFHVTYWDYIGWKDRYGDRRYDNRQRQIARFNQQRTIYTPQFVLAGNDYRTYRRFSQDVNDILSQPAAIALQLTAKKITPDVLQVDLFAEPKTGSVSDSVLYLVLYENNLSDQVAAGENKGRLLEHDYVVRQLHGPYMLAARRVGNEQGYLPVASQQLKLSASWSQRDLGLVAFAQKLQNGEVLQAVRLPLVEPD